ncbi:unnamed protein product [Rotaria sp. Silwood2]|nr:unnamed protein product [Rotaria sp. Silwood2]
MTWSVNHFVPLMSSPAYDDSDNISHQSVSKVVTPEKRTFKNNAPIQIRISEFQSSPSRRLRSEHNNETGFAQSAATDAMRETQNSIHEQRQSTIEQQIKPNQENLVNEPAEHRRIRLEKQKQRDQSNRSNGTHEKRKIRLENQNQRTKSNRLNETSEERQIRLTKVKERAQSSRMNETEEQRQIRLEKQRKRYQANRAKKLVEKSAANKLNTQQQNFSAHYVIKLYSPFHSTTTAQAALKGNCITFLQNLPNIVNSLPLKLDDLCDTLTVIFVGAHPPERVHLKKVLTARKKKVTQAMHWLKNNNILYQNVEINIHNINQLPDDDVPEAIMLTMEQKIDDEEIPSERVGYIPDLLADPTESTNSDTIPISNRLNETAEERQIRLKKVKERAQSGRMNETEEQRQIRLEKQRKRSQANRAKKLVEKSTSNKLNTQQQSSSNQLNAAEPNAPCDTQGTSTGNSSDVQCDNGIVLYVNGLFHQNTVKMCTICQKCHDSLSKGNIPKFSPANNMWLGDIPPELQGLTIPEEKLISLYRHNSCVIKLHSPFHSATTAQAALKGNCITFLQSLPNIVNSLPLKLDDLCDTLKVIFVGAHPPERVHLKKILTVRKKKVTEALHWLKKNNILYQNVEINLHNINQLPEDDVPEAIMLTMEQKIGDEETSSERVGYVPDPLADPTESTNSDTIPISNR